MSDPIAEFFAAFAEAARRLAHSHIEQRIADEHGLDLLAFRLMLHVHADGTRVGDLARKVVAHASHTSRALTVLERREWVTRRPGPQDGRVVIVRPTPAGLRASQTLRARLHAELARSVADWSEADLADATTLMRRLAGAL